MWLLWPVWTWIQQRRGWSTSLTWLAAIWRYPKTVRTVWQDPNTVTSIKIMGNKHPNTVTNISEYGTKYLYPKSVRNISKYGKTYPNATTKWELWLRSQPSHFILQHVYPSNEVWCRHGPQYYPPIFSPKTCHLSVKPTCPTQGPWYTTFLLISVESCCRNLPTNGLSRRVAQPGLRFSGRYAWGSVFLCLAQSLSCFPRSSWQWQLSRKGELK